MKTHNDELDIKIAKALRIGVLLAGGLILLGWLSQVSWVNLTERSDVVFEKFRIYENLPLVSVLETLVQNGQWGIVTSYIGLAILIALPALRVFMTFVSFVIHRDFAIAIMAALVFLSLLVSFSLGLRS